jgi:hypothetical protein
MSILNNAQATAIYVAMVSLNNVGGRVDCSIMEAGKTIRVFEEINGSILVSCNLRDFEEYENQNAFAEAYGLN